MSVVDLVKDSCEVHYGLRVVDVGDDGDVVVLGHHHDDPLRVIAALNRHARKTWGCYNLLDDRAARISDLAGTVSETWAVLTETRPRTFDWFMEWDHKHREADAFPVTLWRSW